VSQTHCISKTVQGIRGHLARQLYITVAVLKMLYAASIWLTPIQRKGNGMRKSKGSVVFYPLICSLINTAFTRPYRWQCFPLHTHYIRMLKRLPDRYPTPLLCSQSTHQWWKLLRQYTHCCQKGAGSGRRAKQSVGCPHIC
jgi:hypothetical protein